MKAIETMLVLLCFALAATGCSDGQSATTPGAAASGSGGSGASASGSPGGADQAPSSGTGSVKLTLRAK